MSGSTPFSTQLLDQLVQPQGSSLMFDHSHWGRLLLSGTGGLDYLNNQSTNDLSHLGPGAGCETVFVTATAQILDLTTLYVTEAGLWLITSPSRRQSLRETLMRTLIFVRGAKLEDRGEETVLLRLVGARTWEILGQWGLEDPQELPLHHHLTLTIPGVGGAAVRIAQGNGLDLPGVTVLAERDQGEMLQAVLQEAGITLAEPQTWEMLSLVQGRPAADQELTVSYNPLEAGLWRSISLSKGCYIGQEVLAKQVTYGRIRQTLWGVQLEGEVEPGAEVQIQGNKVGVLTRGGWTDQGYVGLAYIRSKFSPQPEQPVQIQGVSGKLISRPYLNYPASE